MPPPATPHCCPVLHCTALYCALYHIRIVLQDEDVRPRPRPAPGIRGPPPPPFSATTPAPFSGSTPAPIPLGFTIC